MAQGLGTSTEKQVRYALSLLEKAGYSTRIVEKKHETIAPIDGFEGKSVERWLHSMHAGQISRAVIDRFQDRDGD